MAADAAGKPLGVGILGIPARPIAKSPTMILRNKAVLGAMLDQQAAKATIDAVAPGGPADKAGLKKGDVIAAIDGKPVANAPELVKMLGTTSRATSSARRSSAASKTMKVSIELVASEKMAMPAGAMAPRSSRP